MSAGGDSHWVDRAPKQSPAMKAAYAGLDVAQKALGEAHSYGYATDDWEPHGEALEIYVEWHKEIGRIAQEESNR